MTRRSLENLDRDLDGLAGGGDGVPVTFADFYVYYNYCVAVQGALPAGPDPVEFFGGEPESGSADYWKRMIRIWDGGDDPPIDDEELYARIEERRQELGKEYPEGDQ